jgi:hypothetical protein
MPGSYRPDRRLSGAPQSLNTKLFSQPWNARAHSGRTRYRQQIFSSSTLRHDATKRLLTGWPAMFCDVEVRSTWVVPLRRASHRFRVRRRVSGVHGQTMCQPTIMPYTARSVQRCRGLAGVHKHDGYLCLVFSALDDIAVLTAPDLSKSFAPPGIRCCIHRPSCLGTMDHHSIPNRDPALWPHREPTLRIGLLAAPP